MSQVAPKTFRARVQGGVLVPEEPLDLPEGTEVTVRVEAPEPWPPVGRREALERWLGHRQSGPVLSDEAFDRSLNNDRF